MQQDRSDAWTTLVGRFNRFVSPVVGYLESFIRQVESVETL
jgi:hypothetical protein